MEKERVFIIKNKNDYRLYWNNQFGWCNKPCADVFSEYEKNTLHLPIEGFWVFSGFKTK